MKYRAICFDFDYTLGDSTDSIVAGFQYGFTRLGWPAPDRETVRRTVGYLLEDAYTLLTGDRDPEHRAAFRPLFLEASMERQRRETTLFPGADAALIQTQVQHSLLSALQKIPAADFRRRLEGRGLAARSYFHPSVGIRAQTAREKYCGKLALTPFRFSGIYSHLFTGRIIQTSAID